MGGPGLVQHGLKPGRGQGDATEPTRSRQKLTPASTPPPTPAVPPCLGGQPGWDGVHVTQRVAQPGVTSLGDSSPTESWG